MTYLDEHKLLGDKQHAFRKRHSCETQLTTVIGNLAKVLDNHGQVDTFILGGGGPTGLMVRASDSGSGDPGSILGRVGVFVSSSKRHLLPKSTGNTQGIGGSVST